jgi:hypothetical protein
VTPDGGQPSRTSKALKGIAGETSKTVKWLGGVVATAAAAIITYFVLQVFGGPSNATASLAQAAVKTADEGSARVAVETTIRSGLTVLNVGRANGALDFRGGVGQLESNDGFITRLLNPYLYLSGPVTDASPFPTSVSRGSATRAWCRYDLTGFGLGSGYFFGAMTGFQSDPAAALRNLHVNGTVEETESVKLFGVETTHYTGEIHTQQLLLNEKDPNLLRLIRGFKKNNPNIRIQVWIGSDDLPVRIRATFHNRNGTLTDVEYDFSDFGVQVDTQPPSAYFGAGTHKCPTHAPGFG